MNEQGDDRLEGYWKVVAFWPFAYEKLLEKDRAYRISIQVELDR
jgi:hypothetical protein